MWDGLIPTASAILRAMVIGVLLILAAYALGSVPTGVLAARAWGVDVRRVGSGNIGAANVLRAAGKWPALITLAGDMLKGFLPVLAARLVTDSTWIVALTALATILGHIWPVFLGFKGGKAVATGAGACIALVPVIGLIMFAVWWGVVLIFRYTSLGAIVTTLATPVAFMLTGQPQPYVLYAVVGGVLVLWRHRENARALLAGTERKVGERAGKGSGRVS